MIKIIKKYRDFFIISKFIDLFLHFCYNYYGDSMSRKKIDLSDIKEKSLEETTTFTDLMSRREKRKRKKEIEIDDIEDMVNEKRKNTEDLTKVIKETKNTKKKENSKTKELNIKEIKNSENKEDKLSNTQILDLTRKMKFNFDNVKEENTEKKKNGVSLLNCIGIINLICIGYYIYLLAFTSYQDNESNYMIAGGIIISLVFFFGLSLVCSKKLRKIFNIINILAIISFIAFNIYTFLK